MKNPRFRASVVSLTRFILWGAALSLMAASPPPAPLSASAPPPAFTDADYADHIAGLRKKHNLKGFDVRVEKPFVVVGDVGPKELAGYATGTVRWAVDRLQAAYFEKPPARIMTIWLLKDAESYAAASLKVAGKKPVSDYGFFDPAANALIMNISTGGGTLVHEIVHPFVAANIPDCPVWFNEGLASLYEQSSERGGRIVGATNWRLAGLQEAIQGKGLQSFKALCGRRPAEFYGEGKAVHYAQARYLFYYLQEKGLLDAFYKRFIKTRKEDPDGYQALANTLGDPDMAKFQKEWEVFVMKLRFDW